MDTKSEHDATLVPDIPPISQTDEKQPPEYVTGLKLAVLLASVTIVVFISLLDTSIIGTAIPKITTEFHSIPDIGWYLGAYTLAAATLIPLAGKLYTEFSTKGTFLSFVFLFELGSLICGVARSSTMFIVGRAISGIGMSGLSNGSLGILNTSVPKAKMPMYIGIVMGIAQMGIVSGPLIGGVLTEHVTWRWCFYINLPVGGLAAVIITFVPIPDAKTKPKLSIAMLRRVLRNLDLPGFALFIPPSVMFLLALQFGSGDEFAWSSPTIIGLFCGAAASLVIFIFWERHVGNRAMLPGSLMKQRIVWVSCIFGSCNICSMIVASNWLPTYFQAVKGDNPFDSGVHILPSILAQLLLVVVGGALISRLGYYLPWALAGAIFMAVGHGLVSTFSSSTSVARWVGYQIIMGAARGASLRTALVAVQNRVSQSELAVAMAMLMTFQNLTASVMSVVSNVVFSQTLSKKIPQYAPSVDARAALHAGSDAHAVRNLVLGHEDELVGVLQAYSEGLRNIFYLLVGVSGVAIVASSGMGWVDVRKTVAKAKNSNEQAEQVSVV